LDLKELKFLFSINGNIGIINKLNIQRRKLKESMEDNLFPADHADGRRKNKLGA